MIPRPTTATTQKRENVSQNDQRPRHNDTYVFLFQLFDHLYVVACLPVAQTVTSSLLYCVEVVIMIHHHYFCCYSLFVDITFRSGGSDSGDGYRSDCLLSIIVIIIIIIIIISISISIILLVTSTLQPWSILLLIIITEDLI